MKVCGFSFIRNAIKYSFPVVESVKSILPVCDKFIIAVGDSEDKTLELIQDIGSDKIKILQTVWNDDLRENGEVLAVETNKAFDSIDEEFDWAFYIQADELVHEKYLDTIQNSMKKWKDFPAVEGLLFKYLHFFGTYDYLGDSRRWYRNEIRIIRNDKTIRSYKDAQGFRINKSKLKVKPIDAYVYHYGWVKHPSVMLIKARNNYRYWHSDQWLEDKFKGVEVFDYSKIDSLEKFSGTHPKIMEERIKSVNWDYDKDIKTKNFSFRYKLLYDFERLTGIRPFEYKNYKKI